MGGALTLIRMVTGVNMLQSEASGLKERKEGSESTLQVKLMWTGWEGWAVPDGLQAVCDLRCVRWLGVHQWV